MIKIGENEQQAVQNKNRRYFILDEQIESKERGSGKSGGDESGDESDSREEESDESDHENSDWFF